MHGGLQTTLSRSISFTGVALHSGIETTITLRPAAPDTGIVWRRIDLLDEPCVQAQPQHVVNTERCTVIGYDGVYIRTVEHVMAALRGLEVDNCYVDVDGEEPPMADGSAAPYVRMVQQAGVRTLPLQRHVVTVSEPIHVSNGASSIVALPSDRFSISCVFTNDHEHPALTDEFGEYDITPSVFATELAAARTMGFLHEVDQLQKNGLALGGNWDVAVIVGDDRILTPLRFSDELVRHKILDLVGDLALLGHLKAHIIAIRPGHRINTELAKKINQHTQVGVKETLARLGR